MNLKNQHHPRPQTFTGAAKHISLLLLAVLVASSAPAQTKFCKAVLAKQTVTLSGGVLIDSFNSMDPGQSTGGRYDQAKRQDGGDVASASDAVNVITGTGRVNVYGHLFTGPSGSVVINGSASVGSLAWVDGGNRNIQPGWYSNNFQVTLPDVSLPGVTFAPLPKKAGSVNGTNYNYVLTTGNYQASSFSLSGGLCINGKVLLYFTNGFQISGQGFVYVAPGASLTVYLGGQSQLSGGGVVNGTGYATNCAYLGLPSCTSIQNSGNSDFVGSIYAPAADISLTGGGSQTLNLAGAVVGKTVTISGNYQFHFDQSLCDGCRPVVLAAPLNQTNCPGAAAIFSISAQGPGLTYQWYKGGNLLPGQGAASLLLPTVSAADAGIYGVVVTSACGNMVSNSATLSVRTSVSASALTNQTNCPGTAANFNTVAGGTGPLSYQWFKNGNPLSGQHSSNLTLTSVGLSDAGTYSVVVAGACGSVSNGATLTVNTSVAIVTPPTNQTSAAGGSAQFSISATGTGLGYQWYFNGGALLGKTNGSLSLNGVSTNSAGAYCVVVSGTCGAPQTNCVTLTVNVPVTVITPPINQTNCPGTTAVFSETAAGTAVSYQWYFNGGLLGGQTNSLLLLSNVSSANAGTYCVVADGAAGGPLTNCSTLTVNANVMVVTPPANSTNCPGTAAIFNVGATGTGLNYQWWKGTAVMAGQTNNILVLNSVSAFDAGTYSVVISGACGSVTNSAGLTVNQNTSIAPLAGATRNIGGSVSFTASASGSGPLSYVWKRNGVVLPGKSTSTLTLTNLQPADGGTYTVEASGICGTAATSSAVLTINLPPTVAISYPTNNSVFVAPATFTLLASAADLDGAVTNVEFFQSTNNLDFVKIGETNVAPYFLVLTNVLTNRYTFTARAVDNLGATGTSAPVNVTVIERPPLTLLGGVTFVPQSGLFHLTNVVFNPTYSIFNAVRIYIYGITNPITVANATGITNGVPYVQSAGPIMPGTAWTNTIKFFVPLGAVTPNPKLVTELVLPATTTLIVTNGTGQRIVRGSVLRDRNFMVEFVTVTNRKYHIQFSGDLKNWTTVQPAISGNGTTIQWIDAGPPETDSLPALASQRFYKVISTP